LSESTPRAARTHEKSIIIERECVCVQQQQQNNNLLLILAHEYTHAGWMATAIQLLLLLLV